MAFLTGCSRSPSTAYAVPLAPAPSRAGAFCLERKLCPRFRLQNGMRFPEQPSTGNCVPELALRMGCSFRIGLQAEIASHSESSFWDTLSARSFVGKAHPILSIQSGTWFPRVLPTGKCVPVWQADGHKLSSPYSSISLSHFGSMVWRMPAVCSFFASMPAERTSIMVKRMSGWP